MCFKVLIILQLDTNLLQPLFVYDRTNSRRPSPNARCFEGRRYSQHGLRALGSVSPPAKGVHTDTYANMQV